MLSRATSSSDILQRPLLGSGSVVNIAEQCSSVRQMLIGSAAVVLMILWGPAYVGVVLTPTVYDLFVDQLQGSGASPTESLPTCLLDLIVGIVP